MPRIAEQTEWLSLIDIYGPFLAGKVLEETFPQGLDKIETPRRQRLRAAYDEWRDAVDDDDVQLDELHEAWTNMVIREALEYEDQVLVAQDELDDQIVYRSPEHDTEEKPDFAVRTDDGVYRLLIAVHPPGIDLEKPSKRDRLPISPAERMTSLCRACDVRLGLITNGEQWMLVNAPIGSTSGYASWFARIWWQEPVTLKAFVSLLGVRRCFGPEDGRLDRLFEASLAFQEEVTDTLGEQVRRAVEVLIQALGRADQDRNGDLLKDVAPEHLYEAGLTVMMRLVFILCAEERDLLLLGDPTYDQYYAISTLRAHLREDADQHGVEVLERRHDAWSRMLSVFRMVYGGVEHENLRMPALGGSVFDPDRFPFLEGRPVGSSYREVPASPLPIDNRTVLLLLDALQVLERKGGAQLLSYRALDVEQIGHVYEGLLEYTVAGLPEPTVVLIGSKKVRRPTITVRELEAISAGTTDAAAKKIADLTGRSKAAIKTALESRGEEADQVALIQACGGDEGLAGRLLPFAPLIQTDSWETLLVYRSGVFAVVPGTDRRETGTHYTPRSLTETIVDRTMGPIVYMGPAEGLPREEWKLKTPAELLDLRICDPAMGSGAFLVEACRYLAQRLVEAWRLAEDAGLVITVEGEVVEAIEDREPLPGYLDDRLILARRLVADRCLYGVDKNPLAVELAKLSIWLVTLSKNRPFAFLDHALRRGDSLVGLSEIRQLEQFALKEEDSIRSTLFGNMTQIISNVISAARIQRMQLERRPSNTVADIEVKATMFNQVQRQTVRLKYLADVILAAYWDGGRRNQLQSRLQAAFHEHFDHFRDGEPADQAASARAVLSKADCPTPFHWPIEFPEVFDRGDALTGGFDAIVGNPPFLGNRLWKSMIGDHMQWQAEMILGQSPGKIDLCVIFHRRVVELIRPSGCYGMLATTNIAEGSAIKVGLREIVKHGDVIYSAKKLPWPGKANVVVAIVCFFRGAYKGETLADGEVCDRIGARLTCEPQDAWVPKKLRCAMLSFEGVNNSKGLAFVIDRSNEWYDELASEPHSLLRPYITGDDITSSALTRVNRFALDIADKQLNEIEKEYPAAFRFLDLVVRPTRTAQALKSYKGLVDRWWQFWNHRAEQMRAVRQHEHVIVFSKVTKYPICTLASSNCIFTNKVVVIGMTRPDLLAICLSTFFTLWLRTFCGGKMEDRINISISESIKKYPLPADQVPHDGMACATKFVELTRSLSKQDGTGLTDLMNRVHSPQCTKGEIAELRECIRRIDAHVAGAYGWDDLALDYGFASARDLVRDDNVRFGVSEEAQAAIMSRLTNLNREMCQAEAKHSAAGT
ncbi:MAG: hypothetical protein RIC55_24435 [Pirellulaceae bacterium]